MKDKSFIPAPNSLWLVVVECRYNVIAVNPKGDGFFIPGQEPCWHFPHVQEWIMEIHPSETEWQTIKLVDQVDQTFRRFVSDKRELGGARGQIVGCEAYRLDFTGFQEGEVHDAIAALRLVAGKAKDL